MAFQDEIRNFASKISSLKDHIHTEEATKTSIILPLFHLLGYDIFNPAEFCPEYIADVGIKKGEKVDYAILNNGSPVILVEVKSINQKLDKHDSQLFRYFATTNAKFAILTNGIVYRFYTDLKEPNKMDKDPFFQFDFSNITDDKIASLNQFAKKNFNIKNIMESASLMRYANYFKTTFAEQLENPSDDFIKFFLKGIFPGTKTQAVIEKFRPILKEILNTYIDELVLCKTPNNVGIPETVGIEEDFHPDLSASQLEMYYTVKNILGKDISDNDITFKVTESYLAILYRGNSRKWICRYVENSAQMILILPDENKREIRYKLNDITDIQNYAFDICQIFKRHLNSNASNASSSPNIQYIYTKWGRYPHPKEAYSVHLDYKYYKHLMEK